MKRGEFIEPIMNADADIQVWLETFVKAQTNIIVPHIESSVHQNVQYRIITTQQGQGGRSSIGQSGEVELQPNIAETMSRLAIRRSVGDLCQINITLLMPDTTERRYDFNCPNPEKDK